MSAAYDRLASNYYNVGLKSTGNPGGLAGPGAVRENWERALADISTVAGEAAADRAAAATAAAAAYAAPGSQATSLATIGIPALGEVVTFPVQEADRQLIDGQTIVVSVNGNAAIQFTGPILSFNPTTRVLSMRAQHVTPGWTSFSTWKIALSAPVDATLTGRVTALEIANAKLRTKALFSAKEFI